MLLNCGVGEDSWESLGLQGDQPVNPEGNQSSIFIGRTDAEDETPILWPPDAKNWLLRKDPEAGKDWRQEEKGMTEGEMVGWHHQLDGRWVWASSGSWWWTRKPGVLQSTGSQRVGHDWATKLNWTECSILSWSKQTLSCGLLGSNSQTKDWNLPQPGVLATGPTRKFLNRCIFFFFWRFISHYLHGWLLCRYLGQ